ncbi:PilZ domain-containing protein [Roseibium aggregatum]|uniref:PilZ domain-containing protein n=1 Tax=Roseibium aggregatum TaxID=187304 RepID=A0A926NZJ6_9HYPH|nr:PilZ domain-containing protein [Roseibium aggregatum]MBD1546648.1 PilZ domain-containing protein [Roseibium aggregatum]
MLGLTHLQDKQDTSEEVLVIDLDNLACIKAVVSNVSEWGCRLTSDHIGELHKHIGIRFSEDEKLIKAHVTSVKGNDAAILFPKGDSMGHEQRRESRHKVSIPVTISDKEDIMEIPGTIVDAGQHGCRVIAEGLQSLPDEILLNIKKFDKPIKGEFAWRNETSAGIHLLWNDHLHMSGPI